MDSEIRSAERNARGSTGGTALSSLYQAKSKLLRALEARNLRVFTLRERFEEHFESEIRVRGTVFPGTVLESHGRTLEITAPKKKVVFVFDTKSGHISEQLWKDP